MKMTSPEASRLAEFLRLFATAIENSQTLDLKELALEFARVVRENEPPNAKRESRILRDANEPPGEILKIISQLQRSKNRDEAIAILRDLRLTRRELLEVARARSVHVAKEDNVARIEEKLVETVIGSRLNSEAIRGSKLASRLPDINPSVLVEATTDLIDKITNTKYNFMFNPKTGKSKLLTFKSNGEIGEGRNDNEFRWRVDNGCVEIINRQNQVYSRFLLLNDGRLRHTNDYDTLSIKGQYLEPVS